MLGIGGRNASMKAVVLKSLIVSCIVLGIVILDEAITSNNNNTIVLHQAFLFHVHCPVSNIKDGSFLYLMNHLGITDPTLRQNIFKQITTTPTFVVFVDAFSANSSDPNNGTVLLSYCGYARLKNETDCSNAKLLCTIPGPMFEVKVKQTIQIIWINKIDSSHLNWTLADENCYGNNSQSMHCMVREKVNESRYDCTYYSPVNFSMEGTTDLRINSSAIPMSPHVHGIESRPAFDGNPFNWFNSIGEKGPGYHSMSSNQYFNRFFPDQKPFLDGLLTVGQADSIKVEEYKNDQPPGMLFYHDHAMAVSLTNYVRGFAGFYIIYDEKQEAVFPTKEEEYMFAFTFFNQGDIRDQSDRSYFGENVFPYVGPIQDNSFLYGSEYVSRNMTYRWRFLNAHFDTTYLNVSFAVFYQTLQDEMGYLYIKEEEPPLNVSPEKFTKNMHTLNFTVIGTDSALFKSAVHDVEMFNLAVAERIQLLIKYDQVPQNVSKIYVVTYDVRDAGQKYVIKLVLTLLPEVSNKYRQPSEFNQLNVSFIDLRTIPETQIVARRMRGLFSRPMEQLFTINMHLQFNKAAAQNPRIGTIQDWYIINTVQELHPIHFHTVNFQVVKTYTLKVIQAGCTLWELDFFRESNISIFQIENNTELCELLGNVTRDQIEALSDQFNSYSLENHFVDGISGKNVMVPLEYNDSNDYRIDGCPLDDQYRYICSETTGQLPVYQYGWKDTAGVAAHHVFVLRIRWTKTLYDSSLVDDTYFVHEEAEMLEFPGTLYHCHMMIHADKRMMRPIVFQPSDRYLASHKTQTFDCNLGSWQDRYQCINEALNCSF